MTAPAFWPKRPSDKWQHRFSKKNALRQRALAALKNCVYKTGAEQIQLLSLSQGREMNITR
jgi:hypothetical protein